jgi:hypothetical protein
MNLAAADGNGAVDLSWAHPAQAPAWYDVHRSGDGGLSWSKVGAAAFPLSVYQDTGVTNGQTYFYCLVSVDSEGFEGPPSAAVSATPTNPAAPAPPTGLAVTDPGTGSALSVSWNPNAEPDLAGYVLHWGTSSGVYTHSQQYGSGTTSALVGGLALETPYYFALKARNTSGMESGFSQEAWGKPTGQRYAIRPPAMIADLRVTRAGNDLVLSWTSPATDVAGGPTSLGEFRVYRAQGPEDFDWNPQESGRTPIQVVPFFSGQTAYGCTDAGAVLLADPVTYLVLAVDAQGNLSPASNPPPSAVMDLRVSKAADGKTLVSFSPVATNIYGQPHLLITHYVLYGFAPPMTSSAQHVRPPSPLLAVTLPAHLPACEPGAVYCYGASDAPLLYTVVAVDNRGNTSLY